MRKLLEINDASAMQSGLWPSLAPNQTALWRDGDNVEFVDGRASKRGGWDPQGADTGGTIRAVEQAYVDGLRRIFLATPAKVFKYDTATQSEIGSGFTGNGYWSLATWGSWLLATDDFGVPQVWKNTGVLGPLAGVRRPRFRLLKKMQNHVLGFYGQAFDWSSKSNPEEWAPTGENSAGDLYIRDLDSDIIAAQPLGNQMAVYAADSMSLISYVGGSLLFGAAPAINGIGALSDSSIIPVGRKHYGLGPKGFFITDGVEFKPLGSPAINRYLRETINWQQGRYCVGFHNEAKTTVEWHYVNQAGGVSGVSFNYETNSWSKSSLSFTAGTEKQVFDYPIVAQGSKWGFLDKGSNNGPVAMTGSLQSFPFDAGDRHKYKRWDLVVVNSELSGAAEVRFGYSDNVADEPSWTDWTPLLLENWLGQDSVYLIMEVRSVASAASFDIGGVTVFGEFTAEAI